ncbi:MAG: hypothetical protein EA426_15530 [Spirochaetaceae bacterium]|nr:MAG: hypothetical protein EA426_15530 [Spirochaetaceae bacterium]
MNDNTIEGSANENGEPTADATNAADAAIRARWDESEATRPERPFFLEPEEITAAREYTGLPGDADAELHARAREIQADDRLVLLAWHAYRSVVEYEEYTRSTPWPALADRLGELEGCFHLLVALATVRATREKHQQMRIPEDVTRATCRQVACFAGNYRAGTGGRLGLYRRQLYWLRNYTDGVIFRIGRFEYRVKRLDFHVSLFRHTETGHVIALAADGRTYTAEGYAAEPRADGAGPGGDTADDRSGAAGDWNASLTETADSFRGYPVHPAGRAISRPVILDRASWTCILKPGDTVLDMHIPAGEPMRSEACADSMRRAPAFFERHFPGETIRGFWCSSWIFGPQLEEILPETSNLVSFMRRLYLCPGTVDRSSLWFIFFDADVRPETAPRDNTLRRVIAEYLERGGLWRNAGMVFPVDDLYRIEQEPYRSGWPEVAKLCGLPTGPAARG